ncbi:MAG: tetratricopeptide repeat protein [Myxococcales bacterium]
MTQGKRIIAGLTLGLTFGTLELATVHARSARADEVDDYTRKLIDLDQRVREMTAEFKDAGPPPPDMADRRVLDAQVLFSLKNYEEAATILLDVVEKYPNSRAYDDAVYLLGESLFQARDYYPSRQYFGLAIKKQTNSKSEQQALQRLIEIALRTGDYEQIDDYLQRLQGVPVQVLEPGVPYVRAKYLYFRGNLPEASAGFASIPPSNPYYFQARYFLGTVMVKNGDLAGASLVFDSILKLQPPDDSGKEIQDLSRLAMGRILYERVQLDRAIEAYQSVGRQSPYFVDALSEQAWTYIKAKEWKKAYRALDLLLLTNPDHKDGPELRLLMGNLNLRMENFYLASDAFSKSRDEFEPIHRQLQSEIVRAQQDPAYFDNLVGKNLDKFDIGTFIPASATRWVQADPDVARMLTLTSDVGEIERALKDSEQIVTKLERAMQTVGRVGIFPDLAAARTRSVEVSNQLVDVRQKFVRQLRSLIESSLTPEEKRDLDHVAGERDGLERRIKNIPLSRQALKAREDEARSQFQQLDGNASELNVQIQSLEAQLVAIEQYYRNSRSQQKIRPEDVQGPVKDLRVAIDELHAQHDKVRDTIAEASREASTAGAAGEEERQMTTRLAQLLKQEQEVQSRAKYRLPADKQTQVDRVYGLLARADAIDAQLIALDQRIDAQADVRLEKVKGYLVAEKDELRQAGSKLGVVVGESQSLGGGLAQAMFTKVAARFYDLVVRSDVGIIDVAWGMKDQKTQAVTKLTTQKNLEAKALDEDFKKLLEEDK